MTAIDEKKTAPSTVEIKNRETVCMTGVLDVVSFDENALVIKTVLGTLSVDGSELKISKLETDSGELNVSGKINGLFYLDREAKSGGIFRRVLR